jgi:RsiW-degrading membrane proteinase PrsW (M82 family)
VPRAAAPIVIGFLGLALGHAAWVHPGIIAVGAIVPALLFALPLAFAGWHAGEPPMLLAIAFLWGAVVATEASAMCNDAFLTWAATASLAPFVLGPIVEEVTKAAGLGFLMWARPDALTTPGRGIVYGGLIGLGFVLTENLSYLMLAVLGGGPDALDRAIWTRAVLVGFHHAVFTATVGAAIGIGGVAGGVVGLVAAVGQHVVWNVVAAPRITALLCNPPTPGGACAPAPEPLALSAWIPLVVVACLGPGIVVLALIATGWFRARPRPVPPPP